MPLLEACNLADQACEHLVADHDVFLVAEREVTLNHGFDLRRELGDVQRVEEFLVDGGEQDVRQLSEFDDLGQIVLELHEFGQTQTQPVDLSQDGFEA